MFESWQNMSSNSYKVLMNVVISSLNEAQARRVQKELLEIDPDLSFSPCREQESLNEAIEFRVSGQADEEQKEALIHRLNSAWDKDEDDEFYWAYGFNTKMFDPKVYYLELEFMPIKK